MVRSMRGECRDGEDMALSLNFSGVLSCERLDSGDSSCVWGVWVLCSVIYWARMRGTGGYVCGPASLSHVGPIMEFTTVRGRSRCYVASPYI